MIGRRREALLERRRVDERLERRSRLPLRLRRAVEVALLEVATADHRPDFAGSRIQRHERGLQRIRFVVVLATLTLLDIGDAARDLGFGGLLHVEVNRRVDLQAALIDALPPETLDQETPDLFFEVLPERLATPERVVQLHRFLQRLVVRRSIDHLRIEHRAERDVAACRGLLEAHRRRVAGGRLHEAGQQRRFRDADGRRRLAEIPERRGLHTVQAVTEIDLVEIQLENLVLAELLLESRRDDDLGQLASVGLLGRQEALPRQLLCDRAAALGETTFSKIAQRRTRNANDVDSVVIVEALILDREDGVHQVRRHARERHIDALFLEDGEGGLVGTIEQRRRLIHRADAAQFLAPRHGHDDSAGVPDGADHRGPQPQRQERRLPRERGMDDGGRRPVIGERA